MLRGASLLVLLAALAGCASSSPIPVAHVSEGAIGAWTVSESRRSRPLEFARRGALSRAHDAPAASRVRDSRDGLPNTGRPVDLSLHGAPIGSALRLLAEAADLGIVLGEGLTAPVDVDLRRVRPVDAMRALAQAHDVELSVEGRTVIARLRGANEAR